jgi:hypothetical protein
MKERLGGTSTGHAAKITLRYPDALVKSRPSLESDLSHAGIGWLLDKLASRKEQSGFRA